MDEETVMVMKVMEMSHDGDGDDAYAFNDLSINKDLCPSTSSLSRSLREVSILRFLVSTNVGSQICLHGAKLFEHTKAVNGQTTVPYELPPTPPMVAKLSDCFILSGFSAMFSPSVNIFIVLAFNI
jgi:hypothetical protein